MAVTGPGVTVMRPPVGDVRDRDAVRARSEGIVGAVVTAPVAATASRVGPVRR
jgi:hypothetical protein